jgi:hypothetical protein
MDIPRIFDLLGAATADINQPTNHSRKEHVLNEICSEYKETGMVVVCILQPDEYNMAMYELWTKVILTQPLKDAAMPEIKHVPHPILERQLFDDWKRKVTFPPLSPMATPAEVRLRRSSIKKFTERFGMLHSTFGASCDPDVFHLQSAWDIRQNPLLYDLNAAILGVNDLWCSLDRQFHRTPGVGDDPFLHTDVNPFVSQHLEDERPSTQGKVLYTDGKLIAVPGTHTPQFYNCMRHVY